ncbi:hypothetical protein [Streptomyces sp. NBC_00233]|uniref:hypothetical protein n=1 Tax=Streptomyces sp. NBC_00233 TaxID=2975686 RepID=UPI00224D651D|nr:hypothetical protein [Streptomyces sp. NBC_00233]MCX5233445.1 hypothetical protein [Streptomyces sp. NBC_00233]
MEQGSTDKTTSQRAYSAKRDASALVFLLFGRSLFWLVPGLSWISWLTGLVLLCLSRRWTIGDKLIGAVGVALTPPVLSGSVLFTAGISRASVLQKFPLPQTQHLRPYWSASAAK